MAFHPPHSLFGAPKRERAVEPSKRKNAWRGTCAERKFAYSTGAVLANCHQSWSLLPARAGLFPQIGVPRVYTAAINAGGRSKACPPSPADATPALPGERQRKSAQRVSGNSKPTHYPRRGQRFSGLLPYSLTAWRFFLLDRARPVLFLARPKREWGVHSRRQSRQKFNSPNSPRTLRFSQ